MKPSEEANKKLSINRETEIYIYFNQLQKIFPKKIIRIGPVGLYIIDWQTLYIN